MAPWSDQRIHDYGGVQLGRPYPVDRRPPPEWAHDPAPRRPRRAPIRSAPRRRAARTPRAARHRVPALILGALALPWIAALAAPLGTSAPAAPRTTDRTALASMLLRPSAPVTDSVRRPAAAPATSDDAAIGRPVRIVVPVLDVDAPVEPISGQSGTLVPPADATSIGWWQEGREPGAGQGAAVLTGHTVHTGGGAFDHLDRLTTGDNVLVRTTAGWVHYTVQRTVAYRKGRLADRAATVFSARGPGRLVLVTCTRFDGTRYLANTVVYAVPVAAGGAGSVSG